MQSLCSNFCSSNSLPSLLLTPNRFDAPFRNLFLNNQFFTSARTTQFIFTSLHFRRHAFPRLHCSGTMAVETPSKRSGLVETGYIYRPHGLQGEVLVKPSTDFPELRFSKPGIRWLRQQVLGREVIEEIELVEGRGHAGQKSWIVRFDGIDSVDKALKLVGSTILVTQNDKPELDEGEFYSHDLVGMTVILKETGEKVGTVVNVFNTGANDLLHVELNSFRQTSDVPEKTEQEIDDSGPRVWIPFVEAIVPDVDLSNKVMLITPPKGLLELNIRSDEKSKKERRQLEWKQRKKFQKRLISAKKKLSEMEQQHVFDGFRYGEKSHGSLLANQIISVNSKLLQLALQSIESRNRNEKQTKNVLKLIENCHLNTIPEQSDSYTKLHEKGLDLISRGKLAIIWVFRGSEQHAIGGSGRDDDSSLHMEELLSDDNMLVEVDARPVVPLVLVCSGESMDDLQQMFTNNDHFAFDSEKIWFLEEEKLPIVSFSPEEPEKRKILMKSPWEILQKPVGSGGIITLLSSSHLLDSLGQLGVEYIQVCNMSAIQNDRLALLGLVHTRDANIGFKSIKKWENLENNLDMIFSINFLKSSVKRVNKLGFEGISKLSEHVEKVDNEWVDVVSSSANSLEFHCSIFSCLNLTPLDKVCLLEVRD